LKKRTKKLLSVGAALELQRRVADSKVFLLLFLQKKKQSCWYLLKAA
jgi:hypothetical protein